MSANAPGVPTPNDPGLGTPFATLKSAIFGLSSDNFTTDNTVTEAIMDWPIILPVNTLRWRLRIGNPGQAGNISLTSVVMGKPAWNANGAYNFMSAPPNVAVTAANLASAGGDLVTPWVADPTLQFSADAMSVLRMGYTCNAGQVVSLSNRIGTTMFGAGVTGDLLNAAITHGTFSPRFQPLDVRFEYQFFGSQPVVLSLGDSIQTAYMDNIAANTPGPCAGWLALAGMRERYAWIDCSAAGLKLSDFISAASAQYARMPASILAQATAIFISLGVNDAATVALATYIANLQAVIATAKSLVAPGARVYVSTVIPQAPFKPGWVTAGAAVGAGSLPTSTAYAANDVLDVGKGTANLETLTVAAGGSTGAGPFNTPFTSVTTKVHNPYESCGLANETRRRDYNNYIRSLPANVQGIFDFDRAISSYLNPWGNMYEYIGGASPFGSNIHPGPGAHAEMAHKVRLVTP